MKPLFAMRILWLAPCLVGCWSSTATPFQCDTKCAADQAQCTCTDDADCWSGLSCLDVATLDARIPQSKTCRWNPQPNRQALIIGFGSQTMGLEVTHSPGLGLRWTSPEDTRFVACAIFTCNPAFRERPHDTGNPSDEAPTNETKLLQIANANACMFEPHISDASRTTISLSGGEQPLGAKPTLACPPVEISERVIDFLAAGCWAYDTNQVIAASELVPIAAADIANVEPSLSVGTRCERDADPCYDAEHQFFGSCLETRCAPRCVDDANCVDVALQILHEPRDIAEGWRCDEMIIPNSPLHACRRPEGSPMTTELGPSAAAHGHPGP